MPTTICSAIELYDHEEPRGEYVLVVEGKSLTEFQKEEQQSWQKISIEEHMRQYESQGIDRREAMKKVAKDRGIPKREVYQSLLASEDQSL